MAEKLGVYTYDSSIGKFTRLSENGSMTNPFRATHNGIDESVLIQKVFFHNPDSDYTIKDLILTPTPSAIIGPSNQYGIKLKMLTGDRQPTQDDWDARVSGDPIYTTDSYGTVSPKNYYFPEIEDQQYYPFWIYTSTPPRTPLLVELGVSLKLDYDLVKV